MAAGVSLVLAATGCSSGAAKALVQGTPTPQLSVSSTPSTAGSTSAATTRRATRTHTVASTSSPSSDQTGSAKAPTTQLRTSTTSKPASSTTTTGTANACTATGSTTTIQMVTGDRFAPASVTINRCDAVKAVYADSTGIPHNWHGHGWTSPDMTSAGQSYTYRFTSTGTFSFFCSYHQGVGMTGTVTVH